MASSHVSCIEKVTTGIFFTWVNAHLPAGIFATIKLVLSLLIKLVLSLLNSFYSKYSLLILIHCSKVVGCRSRSNLRSYTHSLCKWKRWFFGCNSGDRSLSSNDIHLHHLLRCGLSHIQVLFICERLERNRGERFDESIT